MKHTHSQPITRATLAAACALLLGTAAAYGQQSTSYGTDSKRQSTDSTSTTSTSTSAQATANDQATSSTAASTEAGAPTGRDTTATVASGKLGFMDRRFVTKVADGGQAEVAIAELAAQRATNPEVRSFAEKLVKDHTAVNTELQGIASAKNVKLDQDDDKDRAYKRLSKKSGAEFDQEFVEHMIDKHENSIKMFEKASKDAKDADLRSFAAKHVDHLREHLKQAESLRASTMPTGRIDASTSTSTDSTPRTNSTYDSINDKNPNAPATPPASTDSPNTSAESKRDDGR
jgi:putative membrane protein